MKKGSYLGGSSIVRSSGFSSFDPADKRNGKTVLSTKRTKGKPRPAKGETWDDIKHLMPKGEMLSLSVV